MLEPAYTSESVEGATPRSALMWTWSPTCAWQVAAGRELVGPSAMDAKAWFKHKGQWADGEKFGATTAVSAQPTKSELMLNVQSWWRVLSCGA